MKHLRRFLVAIFVIITSWFALTALHRYLDPNTHKTDEEREDAVWIATSKHWLDRQACRWMGLCGLAHYHPDPAAKSWKHKWARNAGQEPLNGDASANYFDWQDISGNGKMVPGDWEGDARVLKEVPQFVLDHAPLIHLYSGEQFWPSHIAEHLFNTSPHVNRTTMNLTNEEHDVYNLNKLNEGRPHQALFLKSKDDVEERPEWLGSAYNKPIPYPAEEEKDDVEQLDQPEDMSAQNYEQEEWWDTSNGPQNKKSSAPYEPSFRSQSRRRRSSKQRRSPVLPRPSGYSPAPVILILVDKGNGILDAFWFYFYSYNLGTTVLNIRFGNHIGDWEHSLMRFHNGVPKAVFFSAHSGGIAYSYKAVEKGKGEGREGRPILYSAKGSHAMYATPGTHPYILPFKLLADVTDRGPLWDPSLNYLAYHYNTSVTHDVESQAISPYTTPSLPRMPSTQEMEATLQPALQNANAPIGWWWYSGRWGDKFYELSDWRQWRFVGQYHYVNGPFGPRWKNLGRSKVCQSPGACVMQDTLEGDGKRDWIGARVVRGLRRR